MDSSPTSTTTTPSAPSTHLPPSHPTTISTGDTLQLVALSMVGIISTVANVVVILTILMTHKLRSTSSSLLVTNLAFADVAVTSLTVPLAACGLLNKRWIFSQVTCSVTSGLSAVFSAASALSVAAIAMDRYLAILHCLRYSVWPRWRYLLIVLACTWLPALLFGFLLSLQTTRVDYVVGQFPCEVVSARSVGYVWTRAVIVFLFPVVLLIFAYTRVIHVARVHSRRIDVVGPRSRKSSNDCSRRAESVSPIGAVAAGAMFSVRKLSILSFPQRLDSGRQQFRISGDLELVTALAGEAAHREAVHSPYTRSCASLKLVLLILVFTLCCGFHTTLSLFQTVSHGVDKGDKVVVSSLLDKGGSVQNHSHSPSGVNMTTAGKEEDDVIDTTHQPLLTVAFWLLVANSMLNPFLYAISSQRFRYFAARLLSKNDSQSHGGPYGGHLFDVSIYSAFLRNLQSPASHRSSGDSCELSQLQQLPLTTMTTDSGVIRRDSNTSNATSSTILESRANSPVPDSSGNSPLPRHKLSARGTSNFLRVPCSLRSDDSLPRVASALPMVNRVDGALPPVEDAVELRDGEATFRRQGSMTSTTGSVCSHCSESFSRFQPSPKRSARSTSTGLRSSDDGFVFSANNAARIRIVVDLV